MVSRLSSGHPSHAHCPGAGSSGKVEAKFHAQDPLIVAEAKRKSKRKLDLERPQKKPKIAAAPGGAADKGEKDALGSRIEVVRRYQLVILDKAMQENTIVYLETGCGKTLIAVLLIKKLAYLVRNEGRKFVAVFLAPTVYLVNQQTEVLKINTDLKVDSFHGAKGVDHWSGGVWQTELDRNEVLVMTPQVLLDALRHGFLKLESFDLLIMDECHRAQKQHAYAKIMREFYHTLTSKKPKVFGMTASPVTKRGVSSLMDSAEQMQRLESLLDCKVYTLEDRFELEAFAPTPNQKTNEYDIPVIAHVDILQKLEDIKERCEKYCDCIMTDDGKPFFKDDGEVAQKILKKIRKLHGSLVYCLQELGLQCALEATNCLQRKMANDISFEEEHVAVKFSKKTFLEEASKVFMAAMPDSSLSSKLYLKDVSEAVAIGLLTPKVLVLVQCLLEYKDVADLRCIVFVDRVVAAMVLSKLVSSLDALSFLSAEFLAGMTASLDVMCKKQQQSTIEQFRAGKVNVLVATDVAEEGLDVQSCSSVIRFDLPKSVRSFIQSRGRARRPGSDYVIFLEANNQKHKEQLEDLIKSEESMRAQALNRTHHLAVPGNHRAEEVELYQVESTGATVNTDSSISLLTRFCSNLPGDKYYRPQPEFTFEIIQGEDSLQVCQLILPLNAPFRELTGPPKRSRSLAKQAVCLEACRKLHEMGQLTDHLVPLIDVEKSEEEEVMNLGCKNVSGAGTNKKKELHLTAATVAMHGDWIKSTRDVVLQAYLVCFTIRPTAEGDSYCDFVFLSSTVIDEDIANTEVPLYLTNNRTVKAKISAAGDYLLSASQLREAKAYQELVFNGMFGKLMRHAKKSELGSSPTKKKMKNLLESSSALDRCWDQSLMYLILPLLPGVVEDSEEIPIDWKSVGDCASAARAFAATDANQEGMGSCSMEKDGKLGDDMLQMACGARPISKIKGMAVLTIHTGKVYSVVEVLKERNADCPFVGAHDARNSDNNTYSSYFKEKYGKVLKVPQQPLLQVKQSHRLHNLLAAGGQGVSAKLKLSEKKAIFVELPPELCLLIGVSNPFIRSLYLIPSVLHRFNALLLAGQLRNDIAKEMPQCAGIEATAVMEALTTLRCLEGFSFEGLELLGDSFLKYAVSRYLFLVFDKKHEGQLSARRCRSICNEMLHCLATAKGLPGYIRDEPFHPEHWFAPGMTCPKTVACKCNLENLTFSVSKKSEEEEEHTSRVFRIGKTCSKGHRWLCSKTVADAVEALIGAYIVYGSSGPALGFMKWLGMNIDFDFVLYKKARERSFVPPDVLHGLNISGLEAQLDYSFSNKSLLVEAITHASQQDSHGGCCYQRLEFLGDAVLDYLITHHLFLAHPGLSPGVLSDLRSAAVNNDCFARCAVKHNLQRYLRHGSGELLTQITEFVKSVQKEGDDNEAFGWEGVHGPKVLGDLVESIAGAILVDSGFDLETVWGAIERLLSPIVTPATLPLQPVRELHELSQYERFSFTWKQTGRKGKSAYATAEIERGKEVITETGTGQHLKAAKKDAAKLVLAVLKTKGIVHPRRTAVEECNVTCPNTPTQFEIVGEKRQFDGSGYGLDEKRQRLSVELMEPIKNVALPEASQNNCCHVPEAISGERADQLLKTSELKGKKEKKAIPDELVHSTMSVLEKGGGRSYLNEYCLKKKWKGPDYELSMQEGEDHSKRFTFSVVVHGHSTGPVCGLGDPMSSKKKAMDSAAVKVLGVLKERDQYGSNQQAQLL